MFKDKQPLGFVKCLPQHNFPYSLFVLLFQKEILSLAPYIKQRQCQTFPVYFFRPWLFKYLFHNMHSMKRNCTELHTILRQEDFMNFF